MRVNNIKLANRPLAKILLCIVVLLLCMAVFYTTNTSNKSPENIVRKERLASGLQLYVTKFERNTEENVFSYYLKSASTHESSFEEDLLNLRPVFVSDSEGAILSCNGGTLNISLSGIIWAFTSMNIPAGSCGKDFSDIQIDIQTK